MAIDLGLLALVLVFGALGAFSGAIKQLGNWIGLAAAYLLARPLAALAAPALAVKFSLPPAAVKIGLSAVGFYPLYMGAALLSGLILHKTLGAVERGRWDRAGGFALGAGKGALLSYLGLSLWLFMEGKLPGNAAAAFAVPHTRATDFVRRNNLLSKIPLPALANIQKLSDAANNPAALAALGSDPKLQALLENPELKAALKDDSLVKALQSGDVESLAKDPRLANLLKDPRLTGQMPDLGAASKVDADTPAQ